MKGDCLSSPSGQTRGDVPASRLILPPTRLILPATVTTSMEQADSPAQTDAAAPPAAPAVEAAQDASPEAAAAAPEACPARLRAKLLPRRASDVPFVAAAFPEYLRIVRTLAGRIVRARKGEPSAMLAAGPEELDEPGLHAALARWGINPAVWLAQFQQLDRQCMRALGTAERVLRRAQEVAQQRFHGISLCRAVFAAAPAPAPAAAPTDGFT